MPQYSSFYDRAIARNKQRRSYFLYISQNAVFLLLRKTAFCAFVDKNKI